ncbi:peptidylprolyl isomerase [Thalassotalea psychrophila]|uniref:Peptidyl-prolyl cis-trans isomerase n=1 Tax=Thalassotalea psychrophila TaxID=3065647 RepID=A0ABY9TXG6_9GAMM|nr:peptidylprolyl isomerase [Colwelliaceae bacterium SQ149]
MKAFTKKIGYVYAFAIGALIIGTLVDNDPALKSIDTFITEQNIDKSVPKWKEQLPKPPQVNFAENKTYFWELVTNKGPVTIELFPQYAPMHVSSTIYLTQLGFYDDLKFHRVIPGFMAQGGDPKGTGRGNPGFKYQGEFHDDASHSKPGMLSMANAGPNTDGSQFFITFKETRFLDGRHTVFGQVVDGMDTLQEFEKLGSQSGRPSEELLIMTAAIAVK